MKVKVLFRDEDVPEAVLDFDRLPKAGDLIHVPKVGKAKVLSALKTRATLDYEGMVVVIRVKR